MATGMTVIAGAGTSFADIEPERTILGELAVAVLDSRTMDDTQVRELARDSDAIITDYFRCDAELISSLSRCRVIASYGAGYDQIDVEAADRAGIIVTNNPDYCVAEVAEHTIALILASYRRLPEYDRHVRAGGWNYLSVPAPRRVAGSRLGIVGYGRIGRAVATLAAGIGFEVLVHDPYLSGDAAGVEIWPLDDLLRAVDVLTLHVPLSDETRGIIGARELALMDLGAGLVNASRGALVDQAALATAISERRLGWAALDAFDPEPPPNEDPLLTLSNVIVTPHAAFYSTEALSKAQEGAAQEVLRVLSGRAPLNPVGQLGRQRN